MTTYTDTSGSRIWRRIVEHKPSFKATFPQQQLHNDLTSPYCTTNIEEIVQWFPV